jgi:predicted dehydrogenase
MKSKLDRKLGVGIVGCGAVADVHLNALKKMNELQIVAVCDKDNRRAQSTSTAWRIGSYYTDMQRMLDDEDISIVSVLTPPSAHAQVAIEALKHNTNVLVEKPLTMTTTDADSIRNALNSSNAKLTMDYNWLFCRVIQEALSRLRPGLGGAIQAMEVICLHTATEPMAAEPNHWSHKLSGGRFAEVLPHPIYLLQSFLGDDLTVKNVTTQKVGPHAWMKSDECHVVLQSDQSVGNIYISFNAPRAAILVDIYAAHEVIRIDLMNQTIIKLGQAVEKSIKVGQSGVTNIEAGKATLGVVQDLTRQALRNVIHSLRYRQGEYALRKIYGEFAESITGHSEPPVSFDTAYNTVRITEEVCDKIT